MFFYYNMSPEQLSGFLNKRFELEDSIINILNRLIGIPILAVGIYAAEITTYKLTIGELDTPDLIFFCLIAGISSAPIWLYIRYISRFKNNEIGRRE